MKKGNRAYYAYKGLITSILINKYNKNNIIMTLISRKWSTSVKTGTVGTKN
jgi:hypothetical protein